MRSAIQRILVTLSLLLSMPVAADGLYSRDLACADQPDERSREICRALERALEWTWTGHAIISPSYRMNSDGVRDVYCTLPVTVSDTVMLLDMAIDSETGSFREVQLNNGATSLLSLLGDRALSEFPAREEIADESRRRAIGYLKEQISLSLAEESSSIFNPAHREYILRDGCQ